MAHRNDAAINLGQLQRKVRLVMGIIFLVVTIAFIFIIPTSSLGFWWYILLFMLLYQGIRFIYDFSTGTCPLMSETGRRNLTAFFAVHGDKVEDPSLAKAIKTKSRIALVKSVILAAFLTGMIYFLDL